MKTLQEKYKGKTQYTLGEWTCYLVGAKWVCVRENEVRTFQSTHSKELYVQDIVRLLTSGEDYK